MSRTQTLRLTITYDEPDEDGWIVACVHGIPGAISQGRTRDEARKNAVDALRLLLTPDEEEINSRSHGDALELEIR